MDYETAQDLFDALASPFPAESIDWRIGSTTGDKTKGMALAYIDARVVMDRLDCICGPDGWQNNYSSGGNGAVVCNIGVLMPNGSWIWKSDGAGHTDVEAEKGMLSDAFKRAAVRFGIGRYLYDLDSPWVELDEKKRSKPGEMRRLAELHDAAVAKIGWGERSGVYAYRLMLQVIKNTVVQPSDAQDFKQKNEGMIAQLPVRMRNHLYEQLDRIGGQAQEAA
jgi:hypothetical protein